MIKIKNKYYELNIDTDRGCIDSLLKNGVNLLSDNQPPLMTARFRGEKGEKLDVNSKNAICSYEEKENEVVLSYKFKGLNAEAKLYVSYNETSEIKFKAEIKGECQLEWLEYPGIAAADTFKDYGGKSKLLWPYNEGALVEDISVRENSVFPYFEPEYPSLGCYGMCPGMVFAPFMAVVNEDVGSLYIGAHDKEFNTRNVDFYRLNGGIKLQMRLYPGVEGGKFESGYETVINIFDGDWHDAAKIYKDFFENERKGFLTPIKENDTLPAWYHDSPVIVTYCVRGHHDMDKMDPNGLFPYINGMKIVDEISEKIGSKIMVILMHWEGTAPWAPPIVWPPYGGEAALKEYIDALHAKGHVLGVYCSGFGWTQNSNVADYNMEKFYEDNNLKEIMCISPEGTLPLSKICTGQRSGYDMCPAHPKVKEILVNEVAGMAKLGIDYAQLLDQNHGGTAYMCYSKDHGHPPVPGKWQNEKVKEIMKEIRDNAKNLGQNMLFGCESAAAEMFIPELLISDNRFELCYTVGQPVPLYSFMYHKYLNNFMGNQVCAEGIINGRKTPLSLQLRLAYSFIAGDFLTLVINDKGNLQWAWGLRDFSEDYMPNTDNAFDLVKNMNAWRKGKFADYLHFGNMVKPFDVTAESKVELYSGNRMEEMEPYYTAKYELEGKEVQFVVNYTDEAIKLKLPEGKFTVYFDAVGKKTSEAEKEVTIEKRSVIAIA
ncbi:MAG: hypothetical protein J6M16_08420 [Clostridia bacterium]|nr:hypothetical protein [Clostridia bacterium]